MSLSSFIFVTGGVMSSLGKGIASSSIASLLQTRGYSIKMKKLDPYINVDPGTMSPHKHGEVFVMSDGTEADLDFGHYERFTGIECSNKDSLTTGKVYSSVLNKERKGDYLGSDIQVIPHITNEIKNWILQDDGNADFIICEIGGTVGDIESLPYIEAIRQLTLELGKSKSMCIHLTYLPYMKTSGELKTKPTQHSVKQLQSMGVQPDILLCRSEKPITNDIKSKLSMFCNVKDNNVIEALDVDNIYLIPNRYHLAGLDKQICKHFNIFNEESEKTSEKEINKKWKVIEDAIISSSKKVSIAIIAKYTQLKDAYISLIQALTHAGFSNNVNIDIVWVDAEETTEQIDEKIKNVSGILVPGGFGIRGIEGKIHCIKFARENNVPFFGICLGMQLAVIESCRNIAKIQNATSREFSKDGEFVIDFMDKWESKGIKESRDIDGEKGGTMRLGSYTCSISSDSLAYNIYKSNIVKERHRHRFEVNLKKYKDVFNDAGLIFSGLSEDGRLPEILERKDHKFFIATQFHPEFKSLPFLAHPIFEAFIKAALI